MVHHGVKVVWRSRGDFAAGRYSRAHQWRFDGGAIVPASSSPHVVPTPLSDPAAVDPEEALVASASASHMLWFLSLARDAGLVVESYEDQAIGIMSSGDEGKIGFSAIELRPRISFVGRIPEAAELAGLHAAAHDRCFIANSLCCPIKVATP